MIHFWQGASNTYNVILSTERFLMSQKSIALFSFLAINTLLHASSYEELITRVQNYSKEAADQGTCEKHGAIFNALQKLRDPKSAELALELSRKVWAVNLTPEDFKPISDFIASAREHARKDDETGFTQNLKKLAEQALEASNNGENGNFDLAIGMLNAHNSRLETVINGYETPAKRLGVRRGSYRGSLGGSDRRASRKLEVEEEEVEGAGQATADKEEKEALEAAAQKAQLEEEQRREEERLAQEQAKREQEEIARKEQLEAEQQELERKAQEEAQKAEIEKEQQKAAQKQERVAKIKAAQERKEQAQLEDKKKEEAAQRKLEEERQEAERKARIERELKEEEARLENERALREKEEKNALVKAQAAAQKELQEKIAREAADKAKVADEEKKELTKNVPCVHNRNTGSSYFTARTAAIVGVTSAALIGFWWFGMNPAKNASRESGSPE